MMKSVLRYSLLVFAFLILSGGIYAAYLATKVPWYTWRMAAVNSYSVVPSSAVRLELRAAMQRNDFETVLALLERQKQIAEAIGFTNFMKHDLVENTGLAVRHATLVNKEEMFADWLAELSKIAPREYRLLPMQAHALARSDPEAAEKAASAAIAVLPLDEAPYRGLMKAGLQHDPDRLRLICKSFRSEMLGSFHPWYYQNIGALGQDARTLVVSVETSKQGRVYSYVQGLELGKILASEFNIDQASPSKRFNLIMPTIPGVKLTIYHVQFEGLAKTVTLMPRDLYITPATGYVLSANEVLLTSNQGENIEFQVKKGSFPPFSRIKLSYKLEKLALSSSPDCLETTSR